MDKQLKNGDVLHCSRKSVMSRIISDVTDSRITHTALVVVIHGSTFIIDSQWDGTRMRSFEDWKKKYGYSYEITRRRDVDPRILMDRIKMYINRMYGFGDLIRHLIRRWFGVWLGAKRSAKNLTCSEFVMRVYGNKDAYKASPQDAYDWCIDNNFELISWEI